MVTPKLPLNARFAVITLATAVCWAFAALLALLLAGILNPLIDRII